MTNFDHIKEIEDEDFSNFLISFWDVFCEDVCPMNRSVTGMCSRKCKQGIVLWLYEDYYSKCAVWNSGE